MHVIQNCVFAFKDGRAEGLVGLLDEYGKGVGRTESNYELWDFPVDIGRLDQEGKHIHRCPMAGLPCGYDVHHFSCNNFVLVTGNNQVDPEQNHHQVLRL